jgi:rare lipoprotein A
MMMRFDAAFCGAAFMLACSCLVAFESARAEVRSHKAAAAKNARERATPAPGAAREVASLDGDTCSGDAGRTRSAIIGAASTYNPLRPGFRSGGPQTASGEQYDPVAWTAAIQTRLRAKFGGIRFGKQYRPAYALIESDDKQAIVKINDVGPLRPGRVIDFNEQTMRYFDPAMERGVVRNVKVTPLAGDDCTPGPVEG